MIRRADNNDIFIPSLLILIKYLLSQAEKKKVLNRIIMRFASFSIWLGCVASSALAFSTLTTPSTFGRVGQRVTASNTDPIAYNHKKITKLNIASTDSISVKDMERGV